MIIAFRGIKKWYVLLLIIVLFGCINQETKHSISEKQIKYTSVSIDTVFVNLENSSGIGFSGVSDERLYFFDEFFCHYYPISVDGCLLGNRQIGQGRGPNELPIGKPVGVVEKNNKFLALGGTYDAYQFDNFQNMNRVRFIIPNKMSTYDDVRLYTYYMPELILRLQKNKLYINVYTDAEFFDPIENREKFFKDAHILMEVTLPKGDVRMIGKYSDYYKKNYKKTNHLFGVYYDIDNKGCFHVSFQTDSLIYIYDSDFKEIESFGFKGKDMNQNYEEITQMTRENAPKMQNDLNNKGYYYWYKYINERKLSFRSYQKGSHSDFDGLQIYEEGVLIADVEVPKNFKIEGYIPPYFITRIICDENNDIMWFYRFSLK